jgi:hypothetical protein
MVDRGGYLPSVDVIQEPHKFAACFLVDGASTAIVSKENRHDAHGAACRNNVSGTSAHGE